MNYTVTVELRTTVEFEVSCEEYKEAVQIVCDYFESKEIGVVVQRDDLYTGQGAIGTHKIVGYVQEVISVVPLINENEPEDR